MIFRVEASRRVDLDNLVRPGLAGLRDAGIFTWGYRNLDLIVATKQTSDSPGLDVVLDEAGVGERLGRPGPVLLRATTSTPPRDGDRPSRIAWRECVADSLDHQVDVDECWVEIDASTTRSLEGVMKPVIDGLEPLLGRDPRGRLEFVPNDDKIIHLVVQRQRDASPNLAVTAGPVAAG